MQHTCVINQPHFTLTTLHHRISLLPNLDLDKKVAKAEIWSHYQAVSS